MRSVSALPESPASSLQEIAETVVRRARRQGFVRPKEIREELASAGESPTLWKDVLAVARGSLNYRNGRYYFASPVSERLRQEQDHQASLAQTARRIMGQIKEAAGRSERRSENRIDFVHPVQVRTEDGRVFTLLSRDISTSGMRLLGTRSLLGQKVKVCPTGGSDDESWSFVLRVLWTCAVSDDLFENGGTFVEAHAGE